MSEFEGMTDAESSDHQLKKWVAGVSLHNTVRDECTPDFSCCGAELMPVALRERLYQAYQEKDHATVEQICVMGLTAILDNDAYLGADTGGNNER